MRMFKMKSLSFLVVAAALGSLSLQAEVRLARHFGSNMVLQQGRPAKVWGWAKPGAKVELSFAGQTKMVVADKDGAWKVALAPLAVSKVGRDLVVQELGAASSVVCANVLVGEVWILSGQSNMQWTTNATDDYPRVKTQANYPNLRYMFTDCGAIATAPCIDSPVAATWAVCTTNNVGKMSATGFYFGERLMFDRDVPVGLIMTACGGTSMPNWTPAAYLAKDPMFARTQSAYERDSRAWVATNGFAAACANFRTQCENYYAQIELAKQGKAKYPWPPPAVPYLTTPWKANRIPSAHWNAKVAPLVGLSIAGVLWYQGETEGWAYSTADPAWHFDKMLGTMIEGWRTAWGEDVWFVVSELASMATKHTTNHGHPLVRVRQHELARRIPNVAVACIADTGWEHDVHPHDKTRVGERLSHLARRHVYGETKLARTPEAVSAMLSETGARVVIQTDAGLVARGTLRGFEVKVGGVWRPAASAEIQGNAVLVKAAAGTPEGVRYLWTGWAKPLCSLYDGQNQPVTSFSFPLDIKW